jgi:hypothetical protein
LLQRESPLFEKWREIHISFVQQYQASLVVAIQAAIDMLAGYRDQHVGHISAHLTFLHFLKEQQVDQDFILDTLLNIRQLGILSRAVLFSV